jgi:hypothetical protein
VIRPPVVLYTSLFVTAKTPPQVLILSHLNQVHYLRLHIFFPLLRGVESAEDRNRSKNFHRILDSFQTCKRAACSCLLLLRDFHTSGDLLSSRKLFLQSPSENTPSPRRYNSAPLHFARVVKKNVLFLLFELSSPAPTPRSWVRIPLEQWMFVCVYSVSTACGGG